MWDVHGQTAVETLPGNLAPAATPASKWLIWNGVWDGEHSVCVKHLHPWHFQQVAVQSLIKGRDRNNRTVSEEAVAILAKCAIAFST